MMVNTDIIQLCSSYTKFSNRRAKNHQEFSRMVSPFPGETCSERSGRPFCLIMSDIDKFKSFNDVDRRSPVDEALEFLASLLQKIVRSLRFLLTESPKDKRMFFAQEIT